jgi:hypothetical protein
MTYNRAGNTGVRIGNWVEEGHVAALGPAAPRRAAFGETFARTIAHAQQTPPHQYCSTAKATLVDPRSVRNTARAAGPLTLQREAQFLAAARAEVERAREAEAARGADEWTSVTAADYSARASQSASRVPGVPRGGRKGPKAALPVDAANDELDAPITIWSQRLVEGAVTCSPAHASANPFGRNTAFSVPVTDPIKPKCERFDEGYLGTVTGSAAAHLTQRELLATAQTYLAAQHNPGAVAEAVRGAWPVGYDVADVKLAAKILKQLNLPLTVPKQYALAQYLAGSTANGIASQLLSEPACEPQQQQEQQQRRRQPEDADAEYYCATIANRKGVHEQVSFYVPRALSNRRLTLPEDTAVVKAIVRKQGKVAAQVLSLD